MEYVLHRKSNCKKIKIRVIKGVVQVSAPFYVSKREIDDFVKEQETWIKNQLSKYTVSKEMIRFLYWVTNIDYIILINESVMLKIMIYICIQMQC